MKRKISLYLAVLVVFISANMSTYAADASNEVAVLRDNSVLSEMHKVLIEDDAPINLGRVRATSQTLWDKSYKNEYGIEKSINVTWPSNSFVTGYVNVYIENQGENDILVHLFKDSPMWGQKPFPNDGAVVKPGKGATFRFNAKDIISNVTGPGTTYGKIVVYCVSNPPQGGKPISMYGKSVYYK